MAKRAQSRELLIVEHSVSDAERVSKLIFGNKMPTTKPLHSSVLSKVQKFLPEMEAAEKHRKTLSPEDYNIEYIEKDSAFIEMNVALLEENSDSDETSSDDDDDESSSSDTESNRKLKVTVMDKDSTVKNLQETNERLNDTKS